MFIGTSHFISRAAAIRYYRPYGTDAAEVDRKLADGEIHIGKPEGTASIIPGEGRYRVEVEG